MHLDFWKEMITTNPTAGIRPFVDNAITAHREHSSFIFTHAIHVFRILSPCVVIRSFFIFPFFLSSQSLNAHFVKKYVHSQWNYIHLLLSLGLCLRLRKNAHIKAHFQSQNHSTTAFELNTSFWNCWIFFKKMPDFISFACIVSLWLRICLKKIPCHQIQYQIIQNGTRREWSRAHKWKSNTGVLSRLIKEQEKH